MPSSLITLWIVLGAVGFVAYVGWVAARLRHRLHRAAQERVELQHAYERMAVERDELLEQAALSAALCRQLTRASEKPLIHQTILRQFADLAAVDSTLPRVSLWRYDPALYGLILEASLPQASEWLATDRLSVKEVPFAMELEEARPVILPQVPEALSRLSSKPFTKSDGIACIPIIVEGRSHGLVLMVCSPAQLALLQRGMRAVMLAAMQASLGIASLLHRELAMLDPLTRVYNVAYFKDRLKQEMQRAHRFELALSLLLIDIDEFKKINDTYGHQAGDWVLLKTVQIIKESLRSVDLLARYGGDEFIAMLPETGRGKDPKSCEALPVAERIRRAIAEHSFELPPHRLRVTVSAGISFREPQSLNAVDSAALFKQADTQLYRAKRAGRNRCAFPDGQ